VIYRFASLGHTYRFPSDDGFQEGDFLLVGPLIERHDVFSPRGSGTMV
jgi:hypothetical protein